MPKKSKFVFRYHELDFFVLAISFMVLVLLDPLPRALLLGVLDLFPIKDLSDFFGALLFDLAFIFGLGLSLWVPFSSKKNHVVQEKLMMFFLSIILMLVATFVILNGFLGPEGGDSFLVQPSGLDFFHMSIAYFNFVKAFVLVLSKGELTHLVQNKLEHKAVLVRALFAAAFTFFIYSALKIDWLSSLNLCIFFVPFIFHHARIFRALQ